MLAIVAQKHRRRVSLLMLASLLIGGGSAAYWFVCNSRARADAINSTDFVITIDTTKGAGLNGASTDTQFTYPGLGSDAYTIDCNNDGVVDASVAANTQHTCNYPTPGVYTVRIASAIPRVTFNGQGDKLKLLSVDQWGTGKWVSMMNSFYGCSNMDVKASDVPDLSLVQDLSGMFSGATSLKGESANWAWDTSNVKYTDTMFVRASNFNQNIGSWDMSNVESMTRMFNDAAAFNNGGSSSISAWNTSKATSMEGVFWGAKAFNQPVGSWNVSNATSFALMFMDTENFNQDLSHWDTSKATNMSNTFYRALVFNQDIGSWDVGHVTNMNHMFDYATAFNNGGSDSINGWNTANATTMEGMFHQASAFNQNIGGWNMANVVNMKNMFNGATVFNNGGSSSIGSWNTANVTSMEYVFESAAAFNQNIGGWNMSHVTSLQRMFRDAASFNNGGSSSINTWDTSNVTDIGGVFWGTKAFNQPVGNWNLSKNTTLWAAFLSAESFNQDLSHWDTSKVTDFSYTFKEASSFDQSLSSWNLAAADTAEDMLSRSKLSVGNYDAALISWDGQSVKPNVKLGVDKLKYCVAESARAHLVQQQPGGHGWTLGGTDSKDCAIYQPATTTFTGATTFNSTTPVPHALGTLTTVDTDPTVTPLDTFTYSLTCATPSAHDNLFSVSGNTLSLSRSAAAVSGSVHVCVRVTNSQGQTLDTVFTFTVIDTTPPATPTVAPDLVASSDSGISDTDNITNVTTPTFTLRCSELGGHVTLYIDGVARGTAACTAIGPVTVVASSALGDGSHTVTFTESDALNNESAVSPSLVVVIDTTPPPAPVITVNSITPDNIINIAESKTNQTVTGAVTGAREGDLVTVTVNGVAKTTHVATGGTWSVTVAGSDLATDANHAVDVRITTADDAGNQATGTVSKQYVVDTDVVARPATPHLDPSSDTGASNTDNITSTLTPTIVDFVCTRAGDTLKLYDNGVLFKTIVCTSAGTYSVTMNPPLSEGTHAITYTTTTSSGNVSEPSHPLSLVIDTTAPTGSLTTRKTSDQTPALTGNVDDPHATITVKIGGVTYNAINNGNGTWTLPDNSIAPALAEGDHDITITFTDLAGNVYTTPNTLKLSISINPPVVTKSSKFLNRQTNEVEWTISIRNPNDATQTVSATDQLPGQSAFVANSAVCAVTSINSTINTCNFDQPVNPTRLNVVVALAANETLTVNVRTTTALDRATVTNTVSAQFTADTDPDATVVASATETLAISRPVIPNPGEVISNVTASLASTGTNVFAIAACAGGCIGGAVIVWRKRS